MAGASILTQLPTMGKDLDIPEARLQWPVTAYSITGVSTATIGFALCDPSNLIAFIFCRWVDRAACCCYAVVWPTFMAVRRPSSLGLYGIPFGR